MNFNYPCRAIPSAARRNSETNRTAHREAGPEYAGLSLMVKARKTRKSRPQFPKGGRNTRVLLTWAGN